MSGHHTHISTVSKVCAHTHCEKLWKSRANWDTKLTRLESPYVEFYTVVSATGVILNKAFLDLPPYLDPYQN